MGDKCRAWHGTFMAEIKVEISKSPKLIWEDLSKSFLTENRLVVIGDGGNAAPNRWKIPSVKSRNCRRGRCSMHVLFASRKKIYETETSIPTLYNVYIDREELPQLFGWGSQRGVVYWTDKPIPIWMRIFMDHHLHQTEAVILGRRPPIAHYKILKTPDNQIQLRHCAQDQ